MGSDDVKRIFQPIQDATLAAISPRHSQMLKIEQAIVAFQPDALEIHDMLAAFTPGLNKKYEDATEVLLYMSLLRLALERLDEGWQVDAADSLKAFDAARRKERP